MQSVIAIGKAWPSLRSGGSVARQSLESLSRPLARQTWPSRDRPHASKRALDSHRPQVDDDDDDYYYSYYDGDGDGDDGVAGTK